MHACMHPLYTYTDAGGQTRAALSMASVHLLKFGRHCVPGIPNDTFLVPVLPVIVPVLAVMPFDQIVRDNHRVHTKEVCNGRALDRVTKQKP